MTAIGRCGVAATLNRKTSPKRYRLGMALARCPYPGCVWRWKTGADRPCRDHVAPPSPLLADHVAAVLRGDVENRGSQPVKLAYEVVDPADA
jgi:hypothetical protein